MRLIFAASARTADNLAPTQERLINFVPVPAPQGALASIILRSSLGTREWANLSGPFLRAMGVVDGQLYAVSAGGLYRVPESGAAAYLGAVADDPDTSMAGNRGAVAVAAGGGYYLYEDGLTQPGDGRLSVVKSVAFLNQYTILSGEREIEWTEAGLPDDRNALYFATAEAKDDEIVRVMALDGFLYVFKRASLEIWGPSGSGTAAFRRQGTRNIGLLAYNLATVTPGGIFFIGSDKTARFLSGGDARQVSTPPVDDALARETPSHAFYYEDRGQRLCNVRFGGRPAWVYDAGTGRWHERSSGVSHGPWDIVASAWCYGQWLLGSRDGAIYKVGLTPVDATGPMRRTAVSQPLYAESERFTVNKLEILGRFGANYIEENAPNWITTEYGLPLVTSSGSYLLATDPQPVSKISAPARLWIRVSRDGGYTWGSPKIRDVGRLGDYDARATWRAMGQFRQCTVEINMTDPVDVPLLGEALVE